MSNRIEAETLVYLSPLATLMKKLVRAMPAKTSTRRTSMAWSRRSSPSSTSCLLRYGSARERRVRRLLRAATSTAGSRLRHAVSHDSRLTAHVSRHQENVDHVGIDRHGADEVERRRVVDIDRAAGTRDVQQLAVGAGQQLHPRTALEGRAAR